jgi:hypothetical protein
MLATVDLTNPIFTDLERRGITLKPSVGLSAAIERSAVRPAA